MIKQDKSLELAKLMKWELATYGIKLPIEQQEQRIQTGGELLNDTKLEPYAEDDHGQFKAIILKYPLAALVSCTQLSSPSQADYLDTVLRANGININE